MLSFGREGRAAQRPCPHRRSNGSKNRTKAFVKEKPSCDTFARTLGYKIAQLRSLDALYDERRKVDPALVLKVRYESMQLDEAGTLATVARFLGVEAPRRFLKSSTAVGEKRASDDLRDVVKNNGKHAFSPRAKNFDCGGCELALLGLTMCPMRSEPPYDFPQGVTAAIFHQTVKFKTIFWARTNVVKMSFASNGSKNRTKAFVKEEPSCHTFARTVGYKIAQLRSLDALYEQRRKVDPALVLKVRYESMQLDEAATLATVARFLGVDAPRRFLKSSTAVGEKRASDDLRDVVKNYDEVHKWLAPKGVLASPCLLEMIEVRGPQVFEPCPAPALVARTVTSLSPAKTCPGPSGPRGGRRANFSM